MKTTTALDSTTINRHRNREVALLHLSAVAFAVLSLASVTVPAIGDIVAVTLVALAALAATLWLTRRIARIRRWRREDREDEITAAAWRATHPGSTAIRPAAPGRGVR